MVRSFFSKIKYECTVSLFLLFELLIQCKLNTDINEWFCSFYVVNYAYGIRSRMLVGSFLSLFTSYITRKQLEIFCLFFLVLMTLLAVIFSGRVIRRYEGKTRMYLEICTFILLCVPYGLSFGYSYTYLLDTFLILFSFCALFCVDKKRFVWLIPLISLMGVATHQVYVCMFMPVTGIAMLYSFRETKKKKTLVILFITCAVTFAAFVYFQFLQGTLPFANVDEAVRHLSAKMEIPVERETLNVEYFQDDLYHFQTYGKQRLQGRLVQELVTLASFVPVLVFLVVLWIKSMKKTKEKFLRFLFFLSFIMPVVSLPLFIVTLDWGRWTSLMLIAQFEMFFYFLYRKEKCVVSAFTDIAGFFRRHKQLLFTAFIYLCTFLMLDGSTKGTAGKIIARILNF